MALLYPRLAKKSTAALVAALFLFLPILALARTPNDPLYARQMPFWNQINAPLAWDTTIGSPEVVVALIDTGVDIKHPDLATNIWTNEFEIPNNGVDDDGNGYVDDVHGWNFVADTNDVRTIAAGADLDPDAVRHSTIAAGLIGAIGDNNRAGVGLSWRVRLMPLRAIDNWGGGHTKLVTRAIDYAVANGADIISMSFVGSNYDEDLHQALRRAEQAGVIVSAAAGNHQPYQSGNLNERPLYPICFDVSSATPLVIGVGSVDEADRVSHFSNVGACVDIMAPGENIYSIELFAPEFNFNEEFGGPWRGTSYATPLVAGAAALIKSLRPAWGTAETLHVLRQSADSLSDKNPDYQGLLSAGRLNVAGAIAQTLASGPSEKMVGALYYENASAVWRYDFNAARPTLLARFLDATVVSISTRGTNRYKDTVALVLKRGAYYYVRLTRADGTLLKEFAIDPDESAVWQPRRAAWFADQLTARLLVEEYSAAKKMTRLAAYTIMGERQSELTFLGSLAGWQPARAGNTIIVATLNKKNLILKRVRWGDGATLGTVALNGVSAVLDLKLGNFFSGNEEQAALLARSGSSVKQYIVDIDTQSFRSETVGAWPTSKRPPAWRLWIIKNGAGLESNIMRFHNQGGTFGIFTARGGQVGSVKLPPLKEF